MQDEKIKMNENKIRNGLFIMYLFNDSESLNAYSLKSLILSYL